MHQFTLEEARESVSLAITSLRLKENTDELQGIVDECNKLENPMAQFQLKMTKLIPKVVSILGADISKVIKVDKIENSDVMGYVSQIQKFAATDIPLSVQVSKILKTLGGDFTGLDEDDEEEMEEIE